MKVAPSLAKLPAIASLLELARFRSKVLTSDAEVCFQRMVATDSLLVQAPSHKVIQALEELADGRGWSWNVAADGTLRIRTRGSFLSWGEDVIAKITAEGAYTRVVVQSSPMAQLIDWGTNDRNVQVIRAQLASLGVVG